MSRIRIRDEDTQDSIVVLLGEGSATVTGYGGWEEVSRPRRTGFVDWTGGALKRLNVPLMFDGWADDRDVEGDVRFLESLASDRRGLPPSTVKLSSRAVPHTDLIWVIEALEWGDALRNSDGVLFRQTATVTFLEFVAADITTIKKKQRKAKKSTKLVTVKKGETLVLIAKHHKVTLASVRKLNPKIRDPRKALKVGSKIRLK